MNNDILEGKWRQLSGKVKQQWGKFTDDEVKEVEGNTQRLVGKIQEKYGVARDEAERQVRDWANTAH
ncbi:MAG TPA: CsbD family protein [Parvularculaceae bacterium]|nr:CsbD family protein [Caulobacterales bacterium]HPE31813.1 CsbD family protein [Parvularculaceae bacterium]HRX38676.1 CsbD family protein [Parvularculaceae bacterium]